MVEYRTSPLDRVFQALSDPTRRAILRQLADRPTTVSDLSRPFDLSMAAVSKHLNQLERAGLITRTRRGRERICALEPGAMEDAYEWLGFYQRFWNERLDALEQLLTENQDEHHGNPD